MIPIPMDWTYLLYFIPLLIAVSLVYGGTRHERMSLILAQAWHTAYWITSFIGVIFLVLLVITALL